MRFSMGAVATRSRCRSGFARSCEVALLMRSIPVVRGAGLLPGLLPLLFGGASPAHREAVQGRCRRRLNEGPEKKLHKSRPQASLRRSFDRGGIGGGFNVSAASNVGLVGLRICWRF